MRGIWVAISLSLIGVMLLIGCIPIPGSYQRTDGKPRPETSLGEASSKKPLRTGTATRRAVYALLGAPTRMTADRRTVVYDYPIATSYLLGPLCTWPEGGQASEWRYLRVNFDAKDVVSSFKVSKSPDIEQSLFDYFPATTDDPQPAVEQHLRSF